MKIRCPHCSQPVEIDDADVKSYTAKLAGSKSSEAKKEALQKSAKKPRPGSIGNQRARKKKEPAQLQPAPLQP